MNLTPSQIYTTNVELSKIHCPVHHKNVVVELSTTHINYKACCEVSTNLCDNKIVEVQANFVLDDLTDLLF